MLQNLIKFTSRGSDMNVYSKVKGRKWVSADNTQVISSSVTEFLFYKAHSFRSSVMS
jgi:hypothetical protein